ncbi:BREX-2 system phosphatase PglZ [Streptomyces marincola]|uniref:BREX-2 system phosphatase PglZ n=1 Tax=Streptomyces marincola TaxID=2878388 RepID=UPI001CF50406|nr:BREX-2 system phosphatase PglZ [Streptomyces marincola]UCM87238.1 BREX-2 system phosphatase PglZ [Streptomyces marincola]
MRLNNATITQYLASRSGLVPGKRRVVLLRAEPVWDGPKDLPWGDGRFASVAAAPSPLAVHELVLAHLGRGGRGPDVLVVLTDREDAELGPDLLAKVYKQRVNTVDTWNVVREAFGAQGVDHWLVEEHWAAEALLDAAPPGGWPALSGEQTLSRREALSALALRRLGMGRYQPERAAAAPGRPHADELDSHTLLRWSLTPGGPERLLALRAPERAGLTRFLGEEAGLAGQALLALVHAEHGQDAVAFGLVCAALWCHAEEASDAGISRVRGRAERWFGDEPPVAGGQLDALATAFGRSCEEFFNGQLLTGRSAADDADAAIRRLTTGVLGRASSFVRQFGAETAARYSPVLLEGLEARFSALGAALLDNDQVRADASVRELNAHALSTQHDIRPRVRRAHMARRLSRWLAMEPEAGCRSVADGIGRHIAETGWVDLALEHVESAGDSDPALRAAYDRVCASVRRHRRAIDERFAGTLATWTASGGSSGAMLTVERFLPDVVAPLVASGSRRLLLLVLDGMSAAVAAELGEELREQWAEYDPWPKARDLPRRRGMAAALPTVTAVSRTSLFAGRLASGGQADEKRDFPAHAFWNGQDAAVFHKSDLRADSGGAPFGPELAEALAGDHTHVAVVLNTIDDRLATEDRAVDGAWRVGDIGKLPELLRAAATHGRAVLLTSDHGHVVDRNSGRVDTERALSARHRLPDGSTSASEVRLTGPRVVTSDPGGDIVALWDTDARYGERRAGYHGGAALAEVAIPVLAFLPLGAQPPAGWRELGSQQPAWWRLDGSASPQPTQPDRSVSEVVQARRRSSRGRRARGTSAVARSHDSLFDMTLAPAHDGALLTPTPVDPHAALAAALLTSDVLGQQREMIARAPSPHQVERAVHALLDAGGTLPVTALAQRVGLPPTRADGFAAKLRQVLNRDSVQVLEPLPDGRTVRLHAALLREQFELD